MQRLIFLSLFLAQAALAAVPPVDFDAAAALYKDAAMREQIRPTLGSMPEQIRRLFDSDGGTRLNADQLDAVTAAAKRGFRIDVFEAPALAALTANLDADTVKKAESFLGSEVGKRMVAADVAAANVPQAEIDKIMNGDNPAPSNKQRDQLLDKLEKAERSTESAVQVYLTMGTAIAVGTATGAGNDPVPVGERSRKSSEERRAPLEEHMRAPLRRYMAFSYRDLSDADLKKILAFLESGAGKHYISAYTASIDAGFNAMGRRCGEQLGESLRELAQAQVAITQRDDALPPRR